MNLFAGRPTTGVMRHPHTVSDEHRTPVDAATDELLVVRCQLGERDAFEALVGRWHEPLWRYARRLTGQDVAADDAVQDVWLRVVRGIARLRDRSRFRAWLFGIARRALMDRLRARYAAPDHVALDDREPADAAEPDGLDQALDAMHEELARLPLLEREVLVLFYLRELTLTELADVLAVPPGTVKSRLFRARKLLRQQLIEKGIQP